MATKREMSDYTVFLSVLGHKKFIHKILAKSESVRFQPLFKIFWCSQRIALNILRLVLGLRVADGITVSWSFSETSLTKWVIIRSYCE